MANLYEQLKTKYNLSERYPTMSFDDEKKKIKLYQTTQNQNIKNSIVEMFWNQNKNRVVKQAIILYSSLKKQFQGEMYLEIDDLISKGYRAIPHCLEIYHKIKKRPNETKDEYKKRKEKVTNVRFGTLLQWWIRPYIMQRINQENFLLYVPHSASSKVKSVSVESFEKRIFDDGLKTQLDYIKDSSPLPNEYANNALFWQTIKEKLTAEEYDFLIHWVCYSNYFKSKKEFYKHYNTTPIKTQTKLKHIYAKLRILLKDWL